MKRKIYSALLLLSIALCACGKKEVNTKDGEVTDTEVTAVVEGNFSEPTGQPESEDYTLEDIAKLNDIDVSELNVLYGYNGGIVFLGNKYSDEIVTNEDEALLSLRHISTLVNLDGVNLEYNRTDISPVTGNVVYTFFQTANTELNGETVTAKFYNSLIKVITDSEGNILGASADIVPEYDVETIDENEIITKDEAIDYVKNLIGDSRRRIYENVCEYAFWDDEGTVYRVNSKSKVSPAWFIYADAGNNVAAKPYEVFVVSLSPGYNVDEYGDEYLSPTVIANFYVETLNMDDLVDVYTSVFYFDGMENAGYYTYDINLDWVKKYYPEYEGPNTASYTVPVMYSSEENLYYLGDVDKKITLSNYYDFNYFDTTNAYVTENPDDIYSWHFQLEESVDGSTGQYFNNPNYVLSSFSVMYDVWNDFYDRYDLDSVDGSGLPTMLCVYETEGVEYPSIEEDFELNATNLGQMRDWQVMSTSITFPACLEHEVMAHEYTHGINAQLTMSQYLNGSGAVMESYADIIGAQISMLNDYPESTYENAWHIGGTYGTYMRNMGNPKEFFMPQYLWGNYYLNPVDDVIRSLYDAGGVHTNSSILNYLAYCMVNGTDTNNDVTFTIDENLDIWFDTLYYTNYQSDYFDVACYLQFAAKSLGVSNDKYEYLHTLLSDFGFIQNSDGEFQPAHEEDYSLYTINVEYDESVYNNLKDVFKFGFTFYDETDNYYDAGGVSEDGSLYYSVDPDKEFCLVRFAIGNELSQEDRFYYLDDTAPAPHVIDIFFTVVETEPGSEFYLDPGYELLYVTTYDETEYDYDIDDEGNYSLSVIGTGTIVATIKDNNESSDDYGKYTVLMIISEKKHF